MDGDAGEGAVREELLMGIIRGEIPYVPKDDEEDAGEGASREGAREGEEEDILSYLNPSGDRMEIEILDEGQIEMMTTDNCKQTPMARYIY
jgi:hypothetical protein